MISSQTTQTNHFLQEGRAIHEVCSERNNEMKTNMRRKDEWTHSEEKSCLTVFVDFREWWRTCEQSVNRETRTAVATETIVRAV